jgi:hypothetical protein
MSDEVEVKLDLELTSQGVWPGLTLKNGVKLIETGELDAVWTARDVTTDGGDPVAALRINLGGGRVAIVEISVRALQKVAAILGARYPRRPYAPPTLRKLDPEEVMRKLAARGSEEANRVPGGGEHEREEGAREREAPELGDLAVTREPVDECTNNGDEHGK